jgi:hypothetical protein
MRRDDTFRVPSAGWRLVAAVLLLVHLGLLAWAVMGLLEWFLPGAPWPRLSNPLFPQPLLLVHWLAILGAGGVYVAGYLARWRHTPLAMVGAYAVLAAICAVETLGFLVHGTRFLDMALEYLTYALILAFLFRAPPMRERFGR